MLFLGTDMNNVPFNINGHGTLILLCIMQQGFFGLQKVKYWDKNVDLKKTNKLSFYVHQKYIIGHNVNEMII